MEKIGPIDLEFLHLAIKNGGSFNENDIESSKLKQLGVGRILDSLASLKERRLLEQNSDGAFKISNLAKQILWDSHIPLKAKILRLLEIKSFSERAIRDYLNIESEELVDELELMRKKGWIMISPLRTNSGLEKMFEILPDGLEKLEKSQFDGLEECKSAQTPISHEKILQYLEEIKNQIQNESTLEQMAKKSILEKIEKIKNSLKN